MILRVSPGILRGQAETLLCGLYPRDRHHGYFTGILPERPGHRPGGRDCCTRHSRRSRTSQASHDPTLK